MKTGALHARTFDEVSARRASAAAFEPFLTPRCARATAPAVETVR
jgi:hypothetical protein